MVVGPVVGEQGWGCEGPEYDGGCDGRYVEGGPRSEGDVEGVEEEGEEEEVYGCVDCLAGVCEMV